MNAKSTLRGRLGQLAGGVWGVFGDFEVVLGGFAAVFSVFLSSWSLRLGALWQTFGSFDAHFEHFVEAF